MDRFDYVIVGGGSAGCVLANRLSEDSKTTVLLLEAGPRDRHPAIRVPAAFPTLFDTGLDWKFRTAPQDRLHGRSIYWPRGKVLGGSSSINAMMWIRGFRADYDHWAELAGPDWSYDATEPYRQRAEACSNSNGGHVTVTEQRDPNPLTRAWIAAAHARGLTSNATRNSGYEEGVALALVNQRNGRRVSIADAYLRPASRRPNLHIITKAQALRVLTENQQATGVEYEHGGIRRAYANREVICSAGTIGSPQLLMCSGIGPRTMLERHGIGVVADRAGVGCNLQDHLTAGAVFATTATTTLAKAQSIRQVLRYLVQKKGLLSSNVAEGYGFVRSAPEVVLPDLELLFVPGPFIDEGLTLSRTPGLTVGAVLLQPKSKGTIAIASPDMRVAPTIDPRYLTDDGGVDAATLAAGVRISLDILGSEPIAGLVGSPIQPSGPIGDNFIARSVEHHAQTLYHPVGTCRMGTDSDSVVDEALRVRSVDRLRVIDASVIPAMIRGHTNAPVVMIAEKGAELVQSAAVR